MDDGWCAYHARLEKVEAEDAEEEDDEAVVMAWLKEQEESEEEEGEESEEEADDGMDDGMDDSDRALAEVASTQGKDEELATSDLDDEDEEQEDEEADGGLTGIDPELMRAADAALADAAAVLQPPQTAPQVVQPPQPAQPVEVIIYHYP